MRKKDFEVFDEQKELVYLDSAATSLKPRIVAREVSDYYNKSGASVHRGIYSLSVNITSKYEDVRDKIARLINSDVTEVIFTSGTTDSANKLFMSLSESFNGDFREGDEVIVSVMEHNSVILPLRKFAERHNLKVRYVGINDEGRLDINSFREMINSKTRLVLVTHISNVLGVINPVKEIARIIKHFCDNNVSEIGDINNHLKTPLFIIDGAQAVPHMKIDVSDIDCDFYMFSSHKMCGPTGIGILYGKRKYLRKMQSSSIGGHSVLDVTKDKIVLADIPDRFEPGTPNISGVLGFGRAVDYLELISYDEILRNDKELFMYAISEMGKIDGLEIYGPKTYVDRVGLISFNIKGDSEVHPHDVISILDRDGVCIRGGNHCAMLLLHEMGISSCCRISFYLYNSRQDVDKFILGLKKVKEIFGA